MPGLWKMQAETEMSFWLPVLANRCGADETTSAELPEDSQM